MLHSAFLFGIRPPSLPPLSTVDIRYAPGSVVPLFSHSFHAVEGVGSSGSGVGRPVSSPLVVTEEEEEGVGVDPSFRDLLAQFVAPLIVLPPHEAHEPSVWNEAFRSKYQDLPPQFFWFSLSVLDPKRHDRKRAIHPPNWSSHDEKFVYVVTFTLERDATRERATFSLVIVSESPFVSLYKSLLRRAMCVIMDDCAEHGSFDWNAVLSRFDAVDSASLVFYEDDVLALYSIGMFFSAHQVFLALPVSIVLDIVEAILAGFSIVIYSPNRSILGPIIHALRILALPYHAGQRVFPLLPFAMRSMLEEGHSLVCGVEFDPSLIAMDSQKSLLVVDLNRREINQHLSKSVSEIPRLFHSDHRSQFENRIRDALQVDLNASNVHEKGVLDESELEHMLEVASMSAFLTIYEEMDKLDTNLVVSQNYLRPAEDHPLYGHSTSSLFRLLVEETCDTIGSIEYSNLSSPAPGSPSNSIIRRRLSPEESAYDKLHKYSFTGLRDLVDGLESNPSSPKGFSTPSSPSSYTELVDKITRTGIEDGVNPSPSYSEPDKNHESFLRSDDLYSPSRVPNSTFSSEEEEYTILDGVYRDLMGACSKASEDIEELKLARDRQTKLIQDITKRVERFEIQKERDAMLEKNCHVQLAAVMSEYDKVKVDLEEVKREYERMHSRRGKLQKKLSAVRHREMIERGDSKEELEKERMSFARIEAECRQRYITEASERDSLISQIDSERAKESRLTRHLEEVAEEKKKRLLMNQQILDSLRDRIQNLNMVKRGKSESINESRTSLRNLLADVRSTCTQIDSLVNGVSDTTLDLLEEKDALKSAVNDFVTMLQACFRSDDKDSDAYKAFISNRLPALTRLAKVTVGKLLQRCGKYLDSIAGYGSSRNASISPRSFSSLAQEGLASTDILNERSQDAWDRGRKRVLTHATSLDQSSVPEVDGDASSSAVPTVDESEVIPFSETEDSNSLPSGEEYERKVSSRQRSRSKFSWEGQAWFSGE